MTSCGPMPQCKKSMIGMHSNNDGSQVKKLDGSSCYSPATSPGSGATRRWNLGSASVCCDCSSRMSR
jgi:hypothetical protein